jgi:predicted TIM-barrel fold metal-dependent hydrolase
MKTGRRHFLNTAGFAAAGAAFTTNKPSAQSRATERGGYDFLREVMKYPKIDAHGHLMGGAARLLEAADRLGIERLAISIPRGEMPADFRASNDLVLKAMKEHPRRLLGQCFVNPAHPKEALEEVKRCLDAGMIGLGELYTQVKISDSRYYPLIEHCIKERASVMMHARADLGLLRKGYRAAAPPNTSIADDFVAIGNRYPEAIIIHAHIGGGGDWEYMCKKLREAPSVYVDTSGSVTDEGMIEFAVEQLGAERMLFATDMNFESGVGKILAADLTEAQRRRIFHDNFNAILKKRGINV